MMSSNTRLSDIVLEDKNLSMTAKGVFVSIGFLGNGCKLEQLLASKRIAVCWLCYARWRGWFRH